MNRTLHHTLFAYSLASVLVFPPLVVAHDDSESRHEEHEYLDTEHRAGHDQLEAQHDAAHQFPMTKGEHKELHRQLKKEHKETHRDLRDQQENFHDESD